MTHGDKISDEWTLPPVDGLEVVGWEHKLTGIIRQRGDKPSLGVSDGDYEELCRLSQASSVIAGLEEANEALMRERTSLIETKREQIERLTQERDEAEDAENQAKDCFWAIYPEYLSLGGTPVSTEAARTKLATRISSLEEQNKRLREIVKAVAHIGVDFGFGPYELEHHFIEDARQVLGDHSG